MGRRSRHSSCSRPCDGELRRHGSSIFTRQCFQSLVDQPDFRFHRISPPLRTLTHLSLHLQPNPPECHPPFSFNSKGGEGGDLALNIFSASIRLSYLSILKKYFRC